MQPTASRTINPLTLTSSASRVPQLRSSDRDGDGWAVQRTVTTTPGENGTSMSNFDGEEAPIWQDIGDFYVDYGIHFENAMGIVLPQSSYYPPKSPSTLITAIIPPDFTGGDGHVTITFDFPVSVFGAYATSAMPLSLSCSDSTGAIVGTKYLRTPNLNNGESPFGPNQNIEVRGEGIVRCVFDGSNNLYGFDDFYFSHVDAGVSCNPESPERGEETTCAAKGFAVVNAWSFIPDSAGFPNVRDSVPNNEQEWKGYMVVSGTVRVLGWHKVADAFVRPRDSASIHVAVQPRTDWVPLQMPGAPVDSGQGKLSLLPDANRDITFGLFRFRGPEKWSSATVRSGPNSGYSWINKEPELQRGVVYINPVLDGKGKWAKEQDGEYNGKTTSPNGRPYCNQENLGIFKKEVKRHEGLTGAPNSHYGKYQTELKTTDLHKQLEATVVHGSGKELATKAQQVLDRWQLKQHPVQAAFDTADYGGDKISKLAGGCDWVPTV
ncbi:MAG TPA: hypothetical protein VFK04_05735 [Gemmatimonadaceae bacterium]|nr:hypothetical protein [Gemmatimonadaceae bacterium]